MNRLKNKFYIILMLLVQMQKLHRMVSVDRSVRTEEEHIAAYFRVLPGINESTKHEG